MWRFAYLYPVKFNGRDPKEQIIRKLIAAEFMTLDGVIQNEENDGDGFKYGGWFFPYADEVTGAVVQERLSKPVDLLLGRKTFDGWETFWPTHSNFWPNVMNATRSDLTFYSQTHSL